jgi:very-short-patch-repair endonuclease
VLDIAGRADDRTTYGLIREGEFRRLLHAGAMLDLVRANPCHPGSARVRRVDPMTVEAGLRQTPLEDELEALISSLPLPAFDRQIALVGASGASYSVDFGWRSMRLAVESDSRSAHERSTSFESDRFRDNDLAATGWVTLRFTRIQIEQRGQDVTRQIMATASGRDRRSDR